MHFVVLEHLDIEPPALIADVLLEQGHTLATIRLDRNEALPETLAGIDGAIIMGGPQSANDDHLTYIRNELVWVEKALAAGLPMLGICLGAQVMAKAAGGAIGRSPVRELGWYPIYQEADDPLFAALPTEGLKVFQWHGETFTLPEGATRVAAHPEVPQQAIRLGRGQYGLQFHVEVDEEIIGRWVEAGESERAHLGEAGIARLKKETPAYLPAMRTFCRGMVLSWLNQIG